MPLRKDRDLFKNSTMTFGEHLEELRKCLFKSLIGLILGFLVGLYFAPSVVKFIQQPLEDALEAHYKGAAVKLVERRLKELQALGMPLPGSAEQLAGLVAESDMLPQEVFLQPSEVWRQLQAAYEKAGKHHTETVTLLKKALPSVKRLANDPKAKLNATDRDRLSETVGQLRPSDFPAKDGSDRIEQDYLDVANSIKKGNTVDKSELAGIAKAIQLKQERIEKELARIAEANNLLQSTLFPAKGPDEAISKDDLFSLFIWRPVEDDERIQAKGFNAHEAFMIYVKGALLVGLLLSSWWVFLQIWSFVASGLYYHERRFVYVFGPMSLLLFFAGVALVFLFVFQTVLKFLFTFNDWMGIGIEPRITEWLSFVLVLPLGFGIAFQLPLVMLFLDRIGVFSVQIYLEKWRIAILVIFVLSMLLTPADPGSMLLMAVPLTVLYFGGVLLCKLMPRSRSPYDEPED